MPAIGEVVRYLRGCYEADNREASIFNLRSDRVEHLEFLSKGGDFLRGLLDVVPVERGRALEAQKAAELYKTERSLVFGAVLLTGTVEGPRGKAQVFAPMLYYPARVEAMGEYAVLRVDTQQQRFNTRLLQALMGDDRELDGLLGKIPGAPFKTTDVYDVIAVLEELAPGVNTTHLRGFGNGEAALREAPAAQGEEVRAWWGHVMALIPNSADTRGVLTELEEVATATRHSVPIRTVFGGEFSGRSRGKERRYTLPAQLSTAQEKAVWSAAANTLTVLHGPPGTGKSYTSAVLALDHVARGHSVLIAARTDDALDIIMQKLQGLLGDTSFVLRGGRGGQFADLKQELDKLLSRESQKEITKHLKTTARKRELTGCDLWLGSFRLRRAESRIAARIDDEHRWARASAGGWQKLYRRWLNWKLRNDKVSIDALARFYDDVEEQHGQVAQYLRAKIQRRIWRAVRHHRGELRAFRKALGARTTTKQKKYLEGVSRKTLFRTFPLWVTTIADVHDLIPIEVEQFDLAIIDEATQCDMGSCVPILQRAKRVVVTGDPKQLRHVSFLSRERQRKISERVAGSDDLSDELDFRGRSLLDLVLEHLETDRQLVFLDEHFRCRPELIAFSNQQFYDGKLKVMRACPGEVEAGLRFEKVAGTRDARGVNREEAELVCAAVKELIERERGAAQASSIGMLSPFRDQVEFMERKLIKELALSDIQRHQIRVGTAYSFQGDERDCMFLSLALNDESHGTAFSYLQRPDVFNVSITRARHRQIVFHSFDPRRLGAADLVRGYLEQRRGGARLPAPSEVGGMRSDVIKALAQKGCECRSDLKVGGISIDVAVGWNGRWIGLDLIRNDSSDGVLTLDELRLLERAGFKLYPLGEREWRRDSEGCIHRIGKLLEGSESAGVKNR